MHRRVAAVALVVLSACSSAGTPSTPDVRDALGTIPTDVDLMIDDLHGVLDVAYDDLGDLYDGLVDLRFGPQFAILYDKAGRIEEPGLEDALAAFTDFVGEVLLASDVVDGAVAQQNRRALDAGWARIETAAGVYAVSLAAGPCPDLTPQLVADLCRVDTEDLYEAGIDAAVKSFLSRYRPIVRPVAAISDKAHGEVVANLTGAVIDVIDSTISSIEVLSPPNPYVGIHAALIAHLADLRDLWAAEAAQGSAEVDWETLSGRLDEAACRALPDYEEGRGLLRAAVPDSPTPSVAELWLRGAGTGCSQ